MKRIGVWLCICALAVILCGCAQNAPSGTDADTGVRERLLTDAMDCVGVCSPEKAVDVWVRGLMQRSAAMQYAVMDDSLRDEYAKSLEKTAPDWVTGTSSPRVSGYAIGRIIETAQGQQVYTISVMTDTTDGPAGEYLVVLAVRKQGDFWRIGGICGDDGLSAYTGFE
jgi:hypothetical protein